MPAVWEAWWKGIHRQSLRLHRARCRLKQYWTTLRASVHQALQCALSLLAANGSVPDRRRFTSQASRCACNRQSNESGVRPSRTTMMEWRSPGVVWVPVVRDV